jgi:stage II sporulation protein D
LKFLFFLALLFQIQMGSVRSEAPPVSPTSLALPSGGSIPAVMRVGLLIDVPSATFEVMGRVRLERTSDHSLIYEGETPGGTVHATYSGIIISDFVYEETSFVLSAIENPIKLGHRSYAGKLRVVQSSDSTITVINDVDLDTYVKGVLPVEVSAAWPMETLKAHAVASRTFALFKTLEKTDGAFALYDTVRTQAYAGASAQKPASDEAVDATKGEILTLNGEIFPAFFHANSGGYTEKGDAVWRLEPHPALQAVKDPASIGVKHYEWTFELPLLEIEKVMQENGYPARGLKNISFINYDLSGRMEKVLLQYQRSNLELKGGDFRQFLGYDRFKSLKCTVVVKNDRAKFEGFGWGHGVGLSQWGAKVQAEQGKNYREILSFYYPGSDVQTI